MHNWKPEIGRRLANLKLEPTREAAIVEELAQHLDELYAEWLAGGATEDEAERRTRVELSGSELLARELRRVERQVAPEPITLGTNRRTNMIADLWQDLRFGARMLRKNPGFTATVLLTLALSIGATTTVFTFIDALLLRPLPVVAPGQLYALGTPGRDLNLNPSYFSYPFYRHLREARPQFSGLIALMPTTSANANFGAGDTERVRAEVVSGNYFAVLGVSPAFGRTLTPEDDMTPGAHPFVVLSHDYWQRRFAGAGDVVGRNILLNGHSFMVVGVAARGFFGTRVGVSPDLWATAMMSKEVAQMAPDQRLNNWLELIARLAPGTDVRQASAAASLIRRQWLEAEAAPAGQRQAANLEFVPAGRGLSLLRGQYERPLRILMAAVALLLLLACANVATLLLSRASARQREIAVRLAVGAGRGRLVRQLVTESLLIGLLGGALGWALAAYAGRFLLAFLPSQAQPWQFASNLRVLLFAVGVSLLTGLVFGLAPALLTTRTNLVVALKGDSNASAAGRGFSAHDWLTVVQVALSLLLLIGAALMARTLANLRAVDLGYQREHVLLASLDLAKGGYTREQSADFYQRLVARVRQQPGIEAAGLATYGALGSVLPVGTRFMSTGLRAAGYEPKPNEDLTHYFNIVSPGYFDALHTQLLRGRDFDARDMARSQKVVVINEATARYFFGNEDPVGRRLGRGTAGPTDLEIIGVVRNTKYLDMREENRRIVYLPLAQSPPGLMTLFVRTARDMAEASAIIRREVAALDSTVPLFGVQTMEARVNEALRQEQLLASVSSYLGLLGLLLTAVGVYGVISYAVGRRTREIGVRMALGAQAGDVFRLVIKRGLTLTLIGIALGLTAAFALTRVLASLLYGVSAADPLSFAGVSLLLIGVALSACYIPARRATKVDPMIALRHE
ncbi:MAG: ADOP family duplicated permease [Blastocatellales bacterium]